MSKKFTKEDFVKKAKKIHGDKYDYSKIEYINNSTKVCIICPEHGEFWQQPNNHLQGQGCPKCKGKGNDTESIIQKFKLVHNDIYDYSKVNFERIDRKVCIICPIHGEFWQEPRLHLKGMGCRFCAGKVMNTNEFIRRSLLKHGDKYDYSKVEYVDSHTKVCIICPEHGEFWQQPNNHLQGNGCPKCGYNEVRKKRNLPMKTFLCRTREIHGDKYDYSKVVYKNIDNKVCIICPEHGEFYQTPYKHIIEKQGCPKCNSSHLENEIRLFLKENNILFEEQKRFDWLIYNNNLVLDFFLPQYNIAIECQGKQHFQPVDFAGKGYEWANNEYISILDRDRIKRDLCGKHNIKVLYYSDVDTKSSYFIFKDKKMLLNEIKQCHNQFQTR